MVSDSGGAGFVLARPLEDELTSLGNLRTLKVQGLTVVLWYLQLTRSRLVVSLSLGVYST